MSRTMALLRAAKRLHAMRQSKKTQEKKSKLPSPTVYYAPTPRLQ